jgi:hypothetical protein
MTRALGAWLLAVAFLLCARATRAHDPITTTVTFAREIQAILATRCVKCHATGGPAPMPLTTYEETRPWARAIKDQILTRRMPKWHAARGFGAFKDDPTLTPFEQALIVSWVDGGLPRGPAAVASAFRRNRVTHSGVPVLTVPAGESEASTRLRGRWVSAWSFEPGDPLITSATVTSDTGILGTWVAGDDPIRLPAGMGFRVWGAVRVEVRRRAAADFEQPFTPKRSVLRLTSREGPARRVWTETATCGSPRTGRAAELLAVRPLLADGASARLWVERPGAPRTILGWFRDAEPNFARTYWLARPADLPADARIKSDASCELHVTLVAAR